MVILDSNIIISASRPHNGFLQDYIENNPHVISIISWIEILGYTNITSEEQKFLDEYFVNVTSIDLTDEIVEVAIMLRKTRKMTLGDSIIGATALFNNLTLVTNNEKDFSWIEGLTIINPLTK